MRARAGSSSGGGSGVAWAWRAADLLQRAARIPSTNGTPRALARARRAHTLQFCQQRGMMLYESPDVRWLVAFKYPTIIFALTTTTLLDITLWATFPLLPVADGIPLRLYLFLVHLCAMAARWRANVLGARAVARRFLRAGDLAALYNLTAQSRLILLVS